MTYSSKEKKYKIGRRALLITGAQLLGIAGLGARAKYLQIDQNEHYDLLARNNRIDRVLKPAPRGKIYDSKGLVVADNEDDFRVDLQTSEVSNAELLIKNLAQLIDLSETRQNEIYRKIQDDKSKSLSTVINVADHLSWETFSLLNENLPALEGVRPNRADSRAYPYQDLLAHQVGYVGRVSERDLENMSTIPPIYYSPNMAIGKTGIESKKEDDLRGTEGQQVYEKNAHRRIVRELEFISGQPGKDLQLTLDAEFHHYAMERLKGESASAVVIDVRNGDVKLLASTPSFDANAFVFGISHDDYNTLLNDDHHPLFHKAVQGTYPPGSTFKMVTALAALEAGVVGPGDSFTCRGKINRGRDFWCWKSSGHGSINLKNSLKHSCDVYYYNVAERASIDNISKMARKLGLGEKFDIPQSGVTRGLVPDREWKKEKKGQDWVIGDTFNAGIGQGFVDTSPLQLAVMTARIASGNEVKPNLIASVNSEAIEREVPKPLDINPDHLKWVRQGMYAVSNEAGGTGYRTRINANGQRWAGKTGTAQVVAISKAEREAGVVKNEDRAWNRRDHALFVAFAPYDDPQYAVAVVVEHGGGGSTTAAPIARDMMLYALYDGVPPLSAYPAGRGDAANFWRNVPPLESKRRKVNETEDDEETAGTESA